MLMVLQSYSETFINCIFFSVAYYTKFQFPLFFNVRVMKLKVKVKWEQKVQEGHTKRKNMEGWMEKLWKDRSDG